MNSKTMRVLGLTTLASLGFSTATSTAFASSGINTIVTFDGTNGSVPAAGLLSVGDTLYGTTTTGGSNDNGAVFSLNTTNNTFTTLGSFNSSNSGGYKPNSGLILSGGTLYGTTELGGSSKAGTVFSLPISGGTPTTLGSSTGASNGEYSTAGLTLVGSTLYGTAQLGGANGNGTVFSMPITGGTPTAVVNFVSGVTGNDPQGGLVLGSNGDLYGTTSSGGSGGFGTVFKIDPTDNTLTTLATFNNTNGNGPVADLTLSGNTLYGTTFLGGASGDGTVFSVSTTGGSVTTLASFSGGANGQNPFGGLTLSGGNLYGTTSGLYSYFGSPSDGTVFSLSLATDTLTTLASFDGSNGAEPLGDLTIAGNTLYGTTAYGGANKDGTIFSLALPTPLPAAVWPGILTLAGIAVAGGLRKRKRFAQSIPLPLAWMSPGE